MYEAGASGCVHAQAPAVRRGHAAGRRLATMELEEKSLPISGDRCEECGAKLTQAELEAVMESGGPVLCSIHAAEDEPGLAADEAEFESE